MNILHGEGVSANICGSDPYQYSKLCLLAIPGKYI